MFLRPQNWSQLKPITKALLPPSRRMFPRPKFSRGNKRAVFLKGSFGECALLVQNSYQRIIYVIFKDNLPASLVTGRAPGGTSRKFGFERMFPEGGLDFLEVALVWKFPYGSLSKQTSKKFASEPPQLLRSPSRSGSMRKLVLALS